MATAPPHAPAADRRSALLDATLHLIGSGGLGAVTHRAVEQRAGLPHGSTTYYFKTKQALLEAAVERLVEIDRARADAIAHAVTQALAPRRPLGELDLRAISRAIVAWLEQDRSYQVARYELFVESARRPQLRAVLAAGGEGFLRVLEPIVVAAGSTHPQRDARIALAMANGLMLEQLARPEPDFAEEILPAALGKLLATMR